MYQFRIIAVAASLALAIAALAETVEEKFPDGKIKLKYGTDKDGKKDGPLEERGETGKFKLKATYKAGELNGPSASYHDNGAAAITASYKKGKLHGAYGEKNEKGQTLFTATYKDGKLDGALTRFEAGKAVLTQNFKNGEPAFPRSREQIRKKVAEILGKGGAAPDTAAERDAALRRLKAYRYLSEVPYEDLRLDEEMNRLTEAAAKICAKIGKLDHTPANPGLPEAEYKFAYKGTSSSNLHRGQKNMAASVNGFMDDSDKSNIDAVGHRRWCLNPAMARTGFGREGGFVAMYSFDSSRKAVPDYDLVCHPARGFHPVEFFGARHAWSVTPNPGKYRRVENGAVKVRMHPLDELLARGPEMTIGFQNVEKGWYGVPPCIIFRPENIEIAAGKRYAVEIDGILGSDGRPTPIRYIVEFIGAGL